MWYFHTEYSKISKIVQKKFPFKIFPSNCNSDTHLVHPGWTEANFFWGAIKIYVLDKADFQIIFSRTKKNPKTPA